MFKKISSRITFLQGTNGGRVPHANSLLIQDDVTAVIDTGADRGDLEEVATGCAPDLVINTHFHLDHSRGNRLFSGASILAHPWDARALSSEENYLQASGLARLGRDYVLNYFYSRGSLPVCRVDGFLADGDVMDFGGTKARVIHTPGHTPGHCAFFFEEEEILFAGDIDLTSFGPWYGNPEADIIAFRDSIIKLRDLKPRLVLTGHLEPVEENITERFNQYLAVLDRRDELLLEFLREPRALEAIVDAKLIYRKHPEPELVFRFFEEMMVLKHLAKLEQEGLIAKDDGVYFAL